MGDAFETGATISSSRPVSKEKIWNGPVIGKKIGMLEKTIVRHDLDSPGTGQS
jgi:hypothetical protein